MSGAKNRALETWRKRLNYLQQQEAIVSDPAQKFTLAEQIEEAKEKIEKLETGWTPPPPPALLKDTWAWLRKFAKEHPHLAKIVVVLGIGTILVGGWSLWPPPDKTLATRVEQALSRDSRLAGFNIHAKALDGQVELIGSVESERDEDAAMNTAKGIRWVKSVRSSLRVK